VGAQSKNDQRGLERDDDFMRAISISKIEPRAHACSVASAARHKEEKLQVHVATLGARQHYALPKLLHRSGMLGCFYTDLYVNPASFLVRLLRQIPPKLRPRWMDRVLGRSDSELPACKVISFDAFGLWYQWQVWRARDSEALSRVYVRTNQSFNHRIIRKGLNGADVIYGYDGAALELFQYAKERAIPCILEQTIVPQGMVSALLKEERERWPGWEPGLRVEDEEGVFQERQKEEWRLAELIVGASSIVIESLRQYHVAEAKQRLVPYGIPLERFSPRQRGEPRTSGKLHILFAGGVNLRKGAPYLLEALRRLNSSKVEARFAGTLALDPARLKPYRGMATFLGAVPRNKMMELYEWADLFVLPSICEGSALVTYEALASGIPVIATPNTGAWVRDGVDGVIVPIRDMNALAATIERFCKDQEFLKFCSRNALEGRERLGLDAYQQRLLQIILEVWGRRIRKDGEA
jgi:glycosyltransferase involved in cell wall biosynthesis